METKIENKPVFKGKIKADVLKTMIRTARIIANDCKLIIKKDEMSIVAMDEAHTAIIGSVVKKEAFEEYEGKNAEMAISLESLNTIISLANATDVITIECYKRNKQIVVKHGEITKRIRLLDQTTLPKLNVPDFKLPAMIKVMSGKLQVGILASKAISESILLSITPDYFELYADGDIEDVSLNILKGDLIEHDSMQICRNHYSVGYLNDLTQTFNSNETVLISMGENNPMQLQYGFAEGYGYLTFVQAPVIEETDEDKSYNNEGVVH